MTQEQVHEAVRAQVFAVVGKFPELFDIDRIARIKELHAVLAHTLQECLDEFGNE